MSTLTDYENKTNSLITKFGFGWSTYVQFIHLVEEIGELGEALTVNLKDRKAGEGLSALADHSDLYEEIGDVLFNIFALTKKLNINPDEALNRTFNRYQKKLEQLKNNK